jgi:hypothetical protein
MLNLSMRRQHHDARARKLLTDHPRRLQTLGGMRRRHPDINHHQLGRLLTNQPQELRPITGLPHHHKTRPLQQTGQTLPQQNVILSQDHPQPTHRPNLTIPTRTRPRSIPINRHNHNYRPTHPP